MMRQPITLTAAQIEMGIQLGNEYQRAIATAEAMQRAETIYIDHLRRALNVPADWILQDWLVGFVPPEGEQHAKDD